MEMPIFRRRGCKPMYREIGISSHKAGIRLIKSYCFPAPLKRAITHHMVAKNCMINIKLQIYLFQKVKSEPPAKAYPIQAASRLNMTANVLTNILYPLLIAIVSHRF